MVHGLRSTVYGLRSAVGFARSNGAFAPGNPNATAAAVAAELGAALTREPALDLAGFVTRILPDAGLHIHRLVRWARRVEIRAAAAWRHRATGARDARRAHSGRVIRRSADRSCRQRTDSSQRQTRGTGRSSTATTARIAGQCRRTALAAGDAGARRRHRHRRGGHLRAGTYSSP